MKRGIIQMYLSSCLSGFFESTPIVKVFAIEKQFKLLRTSTDLLFTTVKD